VDLHQPVDIYCERIDPGFWAEPVNAISNIAFLLAAWWAWRRAVRLQAVDGAAVTLVILTALVGVGSFLFHTFATLWAGIADVLPIGLFCLAYLGIALARFFRFSILTAVFGVLSAVGLLIGIAGLMPSGEPGEAAPLNGSLQYAPALIAMALMAVMLAAVGHAAWRSVAAATAVFTLSLALRSIDLLLCAQIPLGTHFLWHLLNGLVFALLLEAVIGARRAPGASA